MNQNHASVSRPLPSDRQSSSAGYPELGQAGCDVGSSFTSSPEGLGSSGSASAGAGTGAIGAGGVGVDAGTAEVERKILFIVTEM